MVADTFIYAVLAWYFAQVWPSKLGVQKPFYFIVQPSYWLSPELYNYWFANAAKSDLQQSLTENAAENTTATAGAVPSTSNANANIPEEEVDEGLLGKPTVVVHKLKKTYGSNVVVNQLSFNMYANQIFALLGHNGAGKVSA
jgi:ATPase subunit of ABC transporter with duplicated ATPase domains